MRRKHALLMFASIMVGIVVVSAWAGPPAPLGAGCIGGRNQRTIYYAVDGTLGITEREFYGTYREGLWVQGTFDPTAEEGPCDRLPGFD